MTATPLYASYAEDPDDDQPAPVSSERLRPFHDPLHTDAAENGAYRQFRAILNKKQQALLDEYQKGHDSTKQ